jgi:hypothetical protein
MKHLLLSTFLVSSSLYAGSLGLNINNEDVELQTIVDMSSAIGYNGVNYLISADYLHTDNDDLFKVGFGASNTFKGASGLTLTLGLETVFGDDYAALPFFTEATLHLPLDEDIPATYLSARLDYAPSVLTFSDAEKYLEYRLEASVEVIDHVFVYGGYRNIDTDYESYDYTLNDSWYGGLKIGF